MQTGATRQRALPRFGSSRQCSYARVPGVRPGVKARLGGPQSPLTGLRARLGCLATGFPCFAEAAQGRPRLLPGAPGGASAFAGDAVHAQDIGRRAGRMSAAESAGCPPQSRQDVRRRAGDACAEGTEGKDAGAALCVRSAGVSPAVSWASRPRSLRVRRSDLLGMLLDPVLDDGRGLVEVVGVNLEAGDGADA